MFKILTLNTISSAGLECFGRDRYELASEILQPHAILVRSADMHTYPIPETLLAVGRAGAGVNNIPVPAFSAQGIPVFNAPGANANAVKELVLAGMFLAARNICPAWQFAVQQTEDNEETLNRLIEAGKKQFVGFELPGRTLGVIGLGAIGVKVANAAVTLGMRVVGYDPGLTVSRAWQLSSEVIEEHSVEGLLRRSDIVTLHIPLMDRTRALIDHKSLHWMKNQATLLNFSRAEVVNDDDVAHALNAKKLHAYICDFPSPALRKCERAVTLPHIGASTEEAERNCAILVIEQIKSFLEKGHIKNSVNFPDVSLARNEGYRLSVVNRNVINIVGQISTKLAQAHLNILDMINKSRDDLAYNLIDVDRPVPADVIDHLKSIDGVLCVRAIM